MNMMGHSWWFEFFLAIILPLVSVAYYQAVGNTEVRKSNFYANPVNVIVFTGIIIKIVFGDFRHLHNGRFTMWLYRKISVFADGETLTMKDDIPKLRPFITT